jgi:hypothetical protein
MIDLAGAAVVEALNDGQDAPALALQERRPTLLAGVQAALGGCVVRFLPHRALWAADSTVPPRGGRALPLAWPFRRWGS